MTIAMSTALARGTQEQDESFGDKLKKLFVRPTAAPKHRKKRKTSLTPTISPSPFASPSETLVSSLAPSPQASATVSAPPSESPHPTTTATVATETRSAIPVESAQTQYFEPVRPITRGPRSRRHATPRTTPMPQITSTVTPAPTTAVTPIITPTPTLTPIPGTRPSPTATAVSRPMPSLPPMIKPAPSPVGKKGAIPNATISTAEISGSESYSPEVRKVIDLGVNLTTQNLGYKINSADPACGGMDWSG